MNILIVSLWLQKAKLWGDLIGGLISLICVPGLIVTSIFWAAGFGSSASMSSTSNSVHAVRGEMSKIRTDISLNTDSQKIVYQLRLVDATGTTVYVYPESDPVDTKPELGNILIQVPNNISKGTYDLYADITYAKNPLRNGVIHSKVSRIVVGEDQ